MEPLTLQMTMYQALQRVTVDRPRQEVAICGPLRLTYGKLQERVDRTGVFLAHLGIRKGDRVMLLLPPGIDFISARAGDRPGRRADSPGGDAAGGEL